MSTSISPTSRIIPNTRFIRPIAYANLAKHKIPMPVRAVFDIQTNNNADDWPIKKKVEAANRINKAKGIKHKISIDDYEDVLKRIDLDVRLKAAVTNYKMEHLKLDHIYEDASLMIEKGRADGDAKVLSMGYKLIHDYEVNMGKLLQRKGSVKKNERAIDITPQFRDPTK